MEPEHVLFCLSLPPPPPLCLILRQFGEGRRLLPVPNSRRTKACLLIVKHAGYRSRTNARLTTESALPNTFCRRCFPFLFQDSGDGDTSSDPSSLPEPFRPRDTLVQDYLGKEGAEQFLSDWDEERSSTSSLSSSPPPSPRPLLSHPSVSSLGGGRAVLGGSSEAQHPPQNELGASIDDTPPPPTSPANGRRHDRGAPERGRELQPPAAGSTAKIRLGDPGLERWASSMMELGKAAAVQIGTAADGEKVAHAAALLGDGPPSPVGGAGVAKNAAAEGPSARNSSPSRSRGPGRVPEGSSSNNINSGSSWAPPVSQQCQHNKHQYHRQQLPQGPAQRDMAERVSPELGQQEQEESGSVESDCSSGDSLSLRPSPPRTSEPGGFTDDRERTGGRGFCGGAGDDGGDGDGDDDDVGIRIVSSSGCGDRNSGRGEIKESAISRPGENESPPSAAVEAAPEGSPPKGPPPRCSLFDLADQSIDEI